MENPLGHRLIQSQTQKLILSPQMRQYVKLLQLPLAQLRTAVEQELAENPALEEVAKEPVEETTEDTRLEDALRSLDRLDEETGSGVASADFSEGESEEMGRRRDFRESLITQKESLFDYLLWQIGFLELTAKERAIAEEIIGNITEDGYLGGTLEEISQAVESTPEEVEKVLRQIQNLDPPGIGARNLQETLLLQLERMGPEAELARTLVQNHLPLLEKKQWDPIAKQLKVPNELIQQAARLVAHLDPKPGRTFYSEDPIAVTPDATVSYDESENGKLQIEVHDEELPEIRISPYYRRLLRNQKLDAQSRRFLKEKIQAAMDFVRALAQRKSTIRRITEEIVDAQTPFFEKGFSELRPLRLKDIANRLGIHESTVSRAIQAKYLSTPKGTLPYKSFFSSRLERFEGGVESQKSMMEKIRELIHSENPHSPLSDQALTGLLQEQGIRIARRTVAKYRELLKILPSHLRAQK